MNPLASVMKHSLLLLLFAFPLLLSQATAGTRKAIELYDAGNYKQAYEVLKDLAAVGNAGALFNLGVMHNRGDGVEKDITQGYAWLYVAGQYGDKRAAATADKIASTLSKAQRERSDTLAKEYMTVYGPEAVRENIRPEPLSGEERGLELKIIKAKQAPYPRAEVNRNRRGYVVLSRTITAEGYVRDIVPLASTTPNFMYAAVWAMRQWLYEPPRSEIHSLPLYDVEVDVKFMLNRRDSHAAYMAEIEEHIDRLREKAETGDPVSQYEYAVQLNRYRLYDNISSSLDIDYRAVNKWYFKAAEGGTAEAQYQIGIKMINGAGYEVNKQGGTKWLKAAASGGYPYAQFAIGRELMRKERRESTLAAITWFEKSAESDHYPSMLLLAWELSTSRFAEVRDGNRAVELLERDPDNYFDDVRVLETKAAAYAETGDFDEAVDHQQEAIEEAKDLEWEIPVMKERLKSYQAERAWRGRYYPFEETKTDKQLTDANEAQVTERTLSND